MLRSGPGAPRAPEAPEADTEPANAEASDGRAWKPPLADDSEEPAWPPTPPPRPIALARTEFGNKRAIPAA